MAKPILLNWGEESVSFAPTRVDRSKIYGSRKRIAVDASGATCTKASLTTDGSLIIKSGMMAQGYFTPEGRWVQRNEMVGLDEECNTVETKPSTLGVPQPLEGPVDAKEVLDLVIQSVYLLAPESVPDKLTEALKSGEVFRFPFNYSADLEVETAYLVSNDEGTFALIGKPRIANFVEETTSFVPDAPDEEEADDLDFDSL
jgi:hypothetical protein